MNWYLVTGAVGGKQVQMMFYSDGPTALMTWGFLTQVSGTGSVFIWGSGAWQPYGPAGAGKHGTG
jgi:hypothetical protein